MAGRHLPQGAILSPFSIFQILIIHLDGYQFLPGQFPVYRIYFLTDIFSESSSVSHISLDDMR